MSANIETNLDELLAIIGTKEVEICQLRKIIDNQARKIAELATQNIRLARGGMAQPDSVGNVLVNDMAPANGNRGASRSNGEESYVETSSGDDN